MVRLILRSPHYTPLWHLMQGSRMTSVSAVDCRPSASEKLFDFDIAGESKGGQSSRNICRLRSSAMEDQANRPHRKTKEKKKHSGGAQSYTITSSSTDENQKTIRKPSHLPILADYRSRLLALTM